MISRSKPSCRSSPPTAREVCINGVGEIDSAVEEFVGLHVLVRVLGTNALVVIELGEEARDAEHHYSETKFEGGKLTQLLGGDLCDAVDVARYGEHLLGDPGSCGAGVRRQCSTERARRAREDEAFDAGVPSCLQQRQGSRDVGLDEVIACVRVEVRLLESCGVDHRVGAVQHLSNEVAIRRRSDDRCVR